MLSVFPSSRKSRKSWKIQIDKTDSYSGSCIPSGLPSSSMLDNYFKGGFDGESSTGSFEKRCSLVRDTSILGKRVSSSSQIPEIMEEEEESLSNSDMLTLSKKVSMQLPE